MPAQIMPYKKRKHPESEVATGGVAKRAKPAVPSSKHAQPTQIRLQALSAKLQALDEAIEPAPAQTLTQALEARLRALGEEIEPTQPSPRDLRSANNAEQTRIDNVRARLKSLNEAIAPAQSGPPDPQSADNPTLTERLEALQKSFKDVDSQRDRTESALFRAHSDRAPQAHPRAYNTSLLESRMGKPLFLQHNPEWRSRLYKVDSYEHWDHPRPKDWGVTVSSNVLNESCFKRKDGGHILPYLVNVSLERGTPATTTFKERAFLNLTSRKDQIFCSRRKDPSRYHDDVRHAEIELWRVSWNDERLPVIPSAEEAILLGMLRNARETLIAVEFLVDADTYDFDSWGANHAISAFLSRRVDGADWTLTVSDPNFRDDQQKFRADAANMSEELKLFSHVLGVAMDATIADVVMRPGLNVNECSDCCMRRSRRPVVRSRGIDTNGICFSGTCLMLLLLTFSPAKFKSGHDAVEFMIEVSDELQRRKVMDKFILAALQPYDKSHWALAAFMENRWPIGRRHSAFAEGR